MAEPHPRPLTRDAETEATEIRKRAGSKRGGRTGNGTARTGGRAKGDRGAARHRELYASRRAKGLCTKCAAPAAVNAKGRTASRCADHLRKAAEQMAAAAKKPSTAEEKAKKARQHRDWYRRRRLAGGCVLCSEPAETGRDGKPKSMCPKHLQARRKAAAN